ncbi:MAG: DegV family protein [Firmicutes bacterium]|nr:DegV family protein [Bacillota bacterium]
MARIGVVTDSIADLPQDLYRENNIEVVPVSVLFGDEVYKDQVDLTTEEFFEKLKTSDVMPTTSQPSPASFLAVYKRMLENYDHIISIHVSSKLSGTYQSALIARETLGSSAIEVIDSGQASTCQGFVALAAARAVAAGRELNEIRRVVRHFMDNVKLLFTVDTLRYLEKNGRIGKASALLGGLLSIKPVISLGEGEVIPVDRVRGAGRVLPRVMELMSQWVGSRKPLHVAVIHGDSPDRAKEWKAEVERRFVCAEVFISKCGPVVGTHTGPGSIGVAWCPAYEG